MRKAPENPKEKKIHLINNDGTEKGSPIPSALSYWETCQWIKKMLESDEDLTTILEYLYNRGVLNRDDLHTICHCL